MTHGKPDTWHPQDWAIVIEALAQWAGPPEQTDNQREERAWNLIEAIGSDLSLSPSELLLQIDEEWPH